MPLLKHNEKANCQIRGSQTKKMILARLKNRCSVGTLLCTQCPNFSTISRKDMIHHFAQKHSASKLDVAFKCKHCYQEFLEFYALRQHKSAQHGFLFKTANVRSDNKTNEVDDANLKEELRQCQHFLGDSQLERARYKVFNDAIENVSAKKWMRGLITF